MYRRRLRCLALRARPIAIAVLPPAAASLRSSHRFFAAAASIFARFARVAHILTHVMLRSLVVGPVLELVESS